MFCYKTQGTRIDITTLTAGLLTAPAKNFIVKKIKMLHKNHFKK